MNCTEFENVVVSIARDEVIEAAAHQESLEHADGCPRCARRLAGEITLSEAMSAMIAEDTARQAPPYVGKMLVEGLRERTIAGRRQRLIWIRRCVTGAVAAMLLIGSALMLRKAEPPRSRDAVTAPADEEINGVADTSGEVTTAGGRHESGAGGASALRADCFRSSRQ